MEILELARLALEEDRWKEDVTSIALCAALGNSEERCSLQLCARQAGVFAGDAWLQAFAEITQLDIRLLAKEGHRFSQGECLAHIGEMCLSCSVWSARCSMV